MQTSLNSNSRTPGQAPHFMASTLTTSLSGRPRWPGNNTSETNPSLDFSNNYNKYCPICLICPIFCKPQIQYRRTWIPAIQYKPDIQLEMCNLPMSFNLTVDIAQIIQLRNCPVSLCPPCIICTIHNYVI